MVTKCFFCLSVLDVHPYHDNRSPGNTMDDIVFLNIVNAVRVRSDKGKINKPASMTFTMNLCSSVRTRPGDPTIMVHCPL